MDDVKKAQLICAHLVEEREILRKAQIHHDKQRRAYMRNIIPIIKPYVDHMLERRRALPENVKLVMRGKCENGTLSKDCANWFWFKNSTYSIEDIRFVNGFFHVDAVDNFTQERTIKFKLDKHYNNRMIDKWLNTYAKEA